MSWLPRPKPVRRTRLGLTTLEGREVPAVAVTAAVYLDDGPTGPPAPSQPPGAIPLEQEYHPLTLDQYGEAFGLPDEFYRPTGDEQLIQREPEGGWAPTGDEELIYREPTDPLGGPSNEATLAADYATPFKNTLEGGLPTGYRVHHTKQQAYGARYALEQINVDDVQYLRGVNEKVHYEINAARTIWANDMMKRMEPKPKTWAEFYARVPLSEVLAQEARIEAQYGHLFVKAGMKPDAVAKVVKAADEFVGSAAFVSGRASRLAAVVPKVAVAVGVLAIFGDGAAMAHAIATDPEEAKQAFRQFESQYKAILKKSLEGRQVSYIEAINLIDSFDNYLKSIKTPDTERGQIVAALKARIDLMGLAP